MIRGAVRWLLALAYLGAGYLHLTSPGPFLKIMPPWVPAPAAVVAASGFAELLGGIGLLQPWSAALRRAAGWGLALYALCVWPANFHHLALDLAQPDYGLGWGYHLPRLFAQPLIIWLALWASEATEWPLARRNADRAR